MTVYFAVLEPGDTVLGMNLAHGGHLTHGSPVNFSGKYYNIAAYGVDPETKEIDYNDVREKALANKPKMIIAGASAYPRAIDFKKFRDIADEVGAYLMVDMAHIAGLIAAGEHENPVPYADFVTSTTHKTLRGPRGGLILCKEEYAKIIDKTLFPGVQGGPLMHVIAAKAVAFGEALQPDFKDYAKQVIVNAKAIAKALQTEGGEILTGGTDNHLLLLDTRSFDLTGKEAEHILDAVGITTNKNAIPFDPASPFITSGVRIGSAAITSRGFDEEASYKIGELIAKSLRNPTDEAIQAEVAKDVLALTDSFPLYE